MRTTCAAVGVTANMPAAYSEENRFDFLSFDVNESAFDWRAALGEQTCLFSFVLPDNIPPTMKPSNISGY